MLKNIIKGFFLKNDPINVIIIQEPINIKIGP